MFGLKSKITFGKYKDKLIEEVIWDNPKYIEWCSSTIEWFKLDNEAKDLLYRIQDSTDNHSLYSNAYYEYDPYDECYD